MEKSGIFSKLIRFFKILIIIILLLYSGFITYFLFLAPKEKRFELATIAGMQGVYFSQKIFDILILQYPDYSDAYFEKSVPFNKRGDYAKGFKLLDKAVSLDPKAHLGYRGWLKYDFLRDYEGSIKDLKRLDSLTPNVVDAPWGRNIHYLLGLSYKGLQKYKFALQEFDKGITTEKDSSWVDPDLFLYKGLVYSRMDSVALALDNFEACLKFKPNSPEAYYYKGIMYTEMGKTDTAKIYLNKAMKLYQKGYKSNDAYKELQDEIYEQDIRRALEIISK